MRRYYLVVIPLIVIGFSLQVLPGDGWHEYVGRGIKWFSLGLFNATFFLDITGYRIVPKQATEVHEK